VVTGAAAAAAERIGRLVYLDAFVPESGTSVFDNMSPKIIENWRQAAKERGEGWKVPPMLNAKSMGVTVAEDAQWLDPRLRPMPLACFEQALQFDEAKLAKLPREYLRCKGFGGFGPTADRLKRSGWPVRELEAGHDAMVAAPAELARALLEVPA
jgi:pimeloyl-ACP methyl ester carboxylesterase